MSIRIGRLQITIRPKRKLVRCSQCNQRIYLGPIPPDSRAYDAKGVSWAVPNLYACSSCVGSYRWQPSRFELLDVEFTRRAILFFWRKVAWPLVKLGVLRMNSSNPRIIDARIRFDPPTLWGSPKVEWEKWLF